MLNILNGSASKFSKPSSQSDTTLQGIHAGQIIKTNVLNILQKIYSWLVVIMAILHHINVFYWMYRRVRALWKPKPYRLRRYEYGATMVYHATLFERCRLYFIGESGKRKRLLAWISGKLPNFSIDNFTVCWSNGIAICALVDAVVPETCPRYDLLNPEYASNNCRLGMRLIARTLGIVEPMTSEEMSNPHRIPQNLMINYLQSIKYASKIPIKEPERTMLKLEETIEVNDTECTSTGSGLVVALQGKRAKFNIHADAFIWKNIFVEISGPKGEYCKRKIDHAKAQKSSRKISGEKDEPDKNNMLIHFEYEEIKSGEYQVIYIPFNTGKYEIKIIWGAENIKNSPFSVTVKEPRVNSVPKGESRGKRVSFNTDDVTRKQSQPASAPPVRQMACRRQSLFRQQNLDSDDTSTAISAEHRNSIKTNENRVSSSIFGSSIKEPTARRRKIIKKIIKCPSGDKEIRYASKSITSQRSVVASKEKTLRNQTENVREQKYGKYADRLSKQLIGRVYYEITKEIIQLKSKNNPLYSGVVKIHNDDLKLEALKNVCQETESKSNGTLRDKEYQEKVNSSESISNCEIEKTTDSVMIGNVVKHSHLKCPNELVESSESNEERISKEPVLPEISKVKSLNKASTNFESKETNKSSSYDLSIDSSMSIDDCLTVPGCKPFRPSWQLPTLDRPPEQFNTNVSKPSVSAVDDTIVHDSNLSSKNQSQEILATISSTFTTQCDKISLSTTEKTYDQLNESKKAEENNVSELLLNQTVPEIPTRFCRSPTNTPETTVIQTPDTFSKVLTDDRDRSLPTQEIVTESAVLTHTRATQSGTRIMRRASRHKSTIDKSTQCTADCIRRATEWNHFYKSHQSVDRDQDLISKPNLKDKQIPDSLVINDNEDIQASKRNEVKIEKGKRHKRSRFGVRQATFDSGFSDEQALSGNGGKIQDAVSTSTQSSPNQLKTPNNSNTILESRPIQSESNVHLNNLTGRLPIPENIVLKTLHSDKSEMTVKDTDNCDKSSSINTDVGIDDTCLRNKPSSPINLQETHDLSGEGNVLAEIERFEPLTNEFMSPVSPLTGSSNDADVSNVDELSDVSMLAEMPRKAKTSHAPDLPVYPFSEWISNINYEMDRGMDSLNEVTNMHHPLDYPFEHFRHREFPYLSPRSGTSSPHDRYRAVYTSDTMSCKSANGFAKNWCNCRRVRRRCMCEDSSSSVTSSDFSCPGRPFSGCKVFGVGLHHGYVNMKNNFQVETSNATRGGFLSVSVRGPHSHCVTETSVIFTGDNLYEIIYEVTVPGFYVITVKWSDKPVLNSPFIVEIKQSA